MMEVKKGFTVEDIHRRARKQIEMAVSNGSTSLRTHIDLDSAIGLKEWRPFPLFGRS